VVAEGGFSGLFPDSSEGAYAFAVAASAPGTAMWCDVQLTKDGVGVCLRDINMKNCTTVDQAFPARRRTHVIDGVRKTGWFAPDFTIAELQSVYRQYHHHYCKLKKASPPSLGLTNYLIIN
jgi:glycerophosphoryl diester phosphodiesterase